MIASAKLVAGAAASLLLMTCVARASVPPLAMENGYVYSEDPCVEALRGAMEKIEPFIPESFHREGGVWHATLDLTDEGLDERVEAGVAWREAKLQCWRH